MARCRLGRAMCLVIDEVRQNVQQNPLQCGRPPQQLDTVRRLLEEHDAACWPCKGTEGDE